MPVHCSVFACSSLQLVTCHRSSRVAYSSLELSFDPLDVYISHSYNPHLTSYLILSSLPFIFIKVISNEFAFDNNIIIYLSNFTATAGAGSTATTSKLPPPFFDHSENSIPRRKAHLIS